jgi:hypothetical protein
MRKLNYKTGIYFLIIVSVIWAASACGKKDDYSGFYTYSSGPCESRTVSLKKVKGFGDKYYLVTVYGESNPEGKEFLGSIKGKRIEVGNGSVIIKDKSIEVISGSKRCIYIPAD